MNILDLKRSLLPLIGYRNEEAQSNHAAENSAFGGDGGGFGMFGMFNAAKDSQQANEVLGFEAVNDSLNDAKISMADREAAGSAIAAMSTEERQAIAQTISGIVSAPEDKRSALAQAGLAILSKAGLPGAIASGLIGFATSPKTNQQKVQDLLDGISGKASQTSATNWGGSHGSTSTGGASTAGSAGQTAVDATAAANKDPATLATSIANQSWNDWQGDKASLQTQVATNTQRGNALYDSATGAANGNMKLVSGMQSDYNSIYRPAGQQYANYVNQLGTDAYKGQQRGIAMANVQQQGDSAMQQQQRAMQRMGVNPSSGRFAAMGNQNAIGMASAKAQAAANSDRAVTQDWANGLTKMSDMGNNTLNAAKGLDSSAQSWNTLGLNAGATGFSQGSDLSKLSGFNASTSGTVAGNAANAIYNQGQLANANAANSRANDAANPWTTIGGAVLTNAAKGIDWGSMFKTSTPAASAANEIDWSTYGTGSNW